MTTMTSGKAYGAARKNVGTRINPSLTSTGSKLRRTGVYGSTTMFHPNGLSPIQEFGWLEIPAN